MAMERERRAWEAEVEGHLAQETAQAARRQEKKEVRWAGAGLRLYLCLWQAQGPCLSSPAASREERCMPRLLRVAGRWLDWAC